MGLLALRKPTLVADGPASHSLHELNTLVCTRLAGLVFKETLKFENKYSVSLKKVNYTQLYIYIFKKS